MVWQITLQCEGGREGGWCGGKQGGGVVCLLIDSVCFCCCVWDVYVVRRGTFFACCPAPQHPRYVGMWGCRAGGMWVGGGAGENVGEG